MSSLRFYGLLLIFMSFAIFIRMAMFGSEIEVISRSVDTNYYADYVAFISQLGASFSALQLLFITLVPAVAVSLSHLFDRRFLNVERELNQIKEILSTEQKASLYLSHGISGNQRATYVGIKLLAQVALFAFFLLPLVWSVDVIFPGYTVIVLFVIFTILTALTQANFLSLDKVNIPLMIHFCIGALLIILIPTTVAVFLLTFSIVRTTVQQIIFKLSWKR